MAMVFALSPAPKGCADPGPLNKAKLMSYTCVAIVFAAVFVVNTLAAAVLSGVFKAEAKKIALTEQLQDRRGCQVKKPSDARKQSQHLSSLQGCDLCWVLTVETDTVRAVIGTSVKLQVLGFDDTVLCMTPAEGEEVLDKQATGNHTAAGPEAGEQLVQWGLF